MCAIKSKFILAMLWNSNAGINIKNMNSLDNLNITFLYILCKYASYRCISNRYKSKKIKIFDSASHGLLSSSDADSKVERRNLLTACRSSSPSITKDDATQRRKWTRPAAYSPVCSTQSLLPRCVFVFLSFFTQRLYALKSKINFIKYKLISSWIYFTLWAAAGFSQQGALKPLKSHERHTGRLKS